jgi:hypothetical protein
MAMATTMTDINSHADIATNGENGDAAKVRYTPPVERPSQAPDAGLNTQDVTP